LGLADFKRSNPIINDKNFSSAINVFFLLDRNDWEPFNPHTNALWLHYLTDKLLKKKTKIKAKDKVIETKLKRFLRQAKKCSSATEIVQDCFD